MVDAVLDGRQACLPPVVLTELLSDPACPKGVAALLRQIPLLALTEGYWEKAGALRARLIEHGRRAPLADALIAQSCLDHGVALVTRDADFRHIARIVALRLLP
jgi:hypothetical protein